MTRKFLSAVALCVSSFICLSSAQDLKGFTQYMPSRQSRAELEAQWNAPKPTPQRKTLKAGKTVEANFLQNYQIETLLGINNQPANMTLSINSDMILIPSSDCTYKCERKVYKASSTAKVLSTDASYGNLDFSNFTVPYDNTTFFGNQVQDRVCLKNANSTCLPQTRSSDFSQFLYIKDYTNEFVPSQTYRGQGILGLAPTNRTSLPSYIDYLKNYSFIDTASFSLYQN